MASQVSRLIQDQNFNVQFNGASVGGKTNGIKAQKKGGLGGRKPLGDLSNAAKPAPTQGSKGKNPKGFTFIEDVTASSKITHEASSKKSLFKDSGKVQTGSRKALSDISNSKNAPLRESSKNKQNMKLSVLEEEQFFPNCIAEEGFLHNHQECLKAQTKIDMGEFLSTIGIDNASVKEFRSPWVMPLLSCKTKFEKTPWEFELEEMPEHVIEDQYPGKQKLYGKLDSPFCKTPKAANYSSALWKDCEINFKVMETPKH
ncbi:hypothetical protein UlMin_024518 [Ulmus minor]